MLSVKVSLWLSLLSGDCVGDGPDPDSESDAIFEGLRVTEIVCSSEMFTVAVSLLV